jgi:hypothetical protein
MATADLSAQAVRRPARIITQGINSSSQASFEASLSDLDVRTLLVDVRPGRGANLKEFGEGNQTRADPMANVIKPEAHAARCAATLFRKVLGENSAVKRCAVCDVLIRNDACCSLRKTPWLRFSRSQMYPSAARELDVASNERPGSFNDVFGIFRKTPWQFRHIRTS